MTNIIIILIIILLNSLQASGEKFIPHFASIKSSEVNVRKGPNARYKIEWVFKKKGEPVEVIAQFEHWNRIRDVTGDEGWVKSVMLSKKRTAVIISPLTNKQHKNSNSKYLVNIHRKPDNSSIIFGKIETSKRVNLDECHKQWCKIKVNDISGWVEKQFLWGVNSNEEFK